jgi:uncharacterized protein GlcG (DUF336 family)
LNPARSIERPPDLTLSDPERIFAAAKAKARAIEPTVAIASRRDGRVLRAIGVSGALSADDETIAIAGAAAA